ncbi:AraC family transcriptional regulator [Paenibacillus lemnae]|uniref:AraC family transcriptional regulator n=1 Tax=Paenibacillus lemnae TaxID=1330551 RepID=A0A848M1Z5_PAELE|nr:AraC family transcriptional regulator [Paenibacillus lemnae]NMO94586.1 AraC family transcriptional regulator [Paenibacillus lemnae]
MYKFPKMMNTLQVSGCHFDTKPSGWHYPRHHHPLFELVCCLEGDVQHVIQRDTITLKPGDWLLIRTGVRHESSNSANKPYRYFNIHFDLDDLNIRRILSLQSYRVVRADQAENTRLPACIKELSAIISRSQPPAPGDDEQKLNFEDQILLQSTTLLILHEVLHLLKHAPDKEATPSTDPAGALSAANLAHTIEERLTQQIDERVLIAETARDLSISRSQCTRLFSKVYGLSPRQYISRYKLNAAKEMLSTSNLTVTEIADRLGFRSPSHFSRQYRRWTGQSPTEYRSK